MPEPRLRHSVRGLIVDENEKVLLCRWNMDGLVVWGTPGGGIEEGESHHEALSRELLEEVGLAVESEIHHVWRQEVVATQLGPNFDSDYELRWRNNWVDAPYHATGFDGVVNDFYLVRASNFEPRGEFSDAQLAAEGQIELRWWPLDQLQAYAGKDAFAPRSLASLLSDLLDGDPPAQAFNVGL